MPRYDYICGKCRKRFSIVEPISVHGSKPQKCPKCKSTKVRQELAPFFAKTTKKS